MNVLSVTQAVKALQNGGIVIFPTDTAYGIGCAVTNISAVERLFRIRQRPLTQATPVLVGSREMVKEYVENISDDVSELMDRYWPGALTIITNAKVEKIPSLVRGGTDTVGIRMPNNNIALEIINSLGMPVLGPSANFHQQPTPYTFDSVSKDLVSLVDGIVEGECSLKRESTVIDTTVNPFSVLRQGAVTLS